MLPASNQELAVEQEPTSEFIEDRKPFSFSSCHDDEMKETSGLTQNLLLDFQIQYAL
jgi:hypothetical protein